MKRVSSLFDEFCLQRTGTPCVTDKLQFEGVDGMDVYNISAPFVSAGKQVIVGRVERRSEELSNIVFFEKSESVWRRIDRAPTFELQDPFVTFVQGELTLGGVQVREINGQLAWKTVFFRGSDIFDLKHFLDGPDGMKDIRFCDLRQDRIAVFTRPQGKTAGRGKIGYTEVAVLDELTIERIESAPLIRNMLHDEDWGGVNEAHRIAGGRIGALAHVSCFEDDDREKALHYYAATFVFDPDAMEFDDLKIIACRSQFKDGPSKREVLADVVFPSGLIFANGAARLYAGVSDVEAHWIDIDNPFSY